MRNPLNLLRRYQRGWRAIRDGATFTYAQHGEDVLIGAAFGLLNLSRPTYLDIGAHHPTALSNTFRLYAAGSRGVCVEPNPALSAAFHHRRPGDVCLNVGIGLGEADAADFYVLSDPTLSTFSKTVADEQVAGGRHWLERVISVPLVGINRIVAEHFQPWPNLLSLDTEGLDFDILRAFDFARFRPEVICLETLTNVGERRMGELINFVLASGYSIFADTYINTVFVESARWAEAVARRNGSKLAPGL